MSTKEISTQAEYDANKDFDGILIIKTKELIVVSGHSRVEARGSSSVVALGSSSVEAWESSRVEARGSSSVVALGSSSVVARGSSSVVALGSSSVVALGSSSVEARGSSRIRGLDNSMILIRGGKVESLYGNATAKNYIDPVYTPEVLPVVGEFEDGKLVLFKSVRPDTGCDFRTGKTKYEVGGTAEAPDFDPDPTRECGGGLHLCLTPAKTQEFNEGTILKCLVDPQDVVVYSGSIEKVRCRKVMPVAVVDRFGRVISGGQE